MEHYRVKGTVAATPQEAFPYVRDFTRYDAYAEVLDAVEPAGDKDQTYRMDLSWWRFAKSVQSRVRAVDAPHELQWELLGSVDAQGRWGLEPVDRGSELTLEATVDLGSIDAIPGGALVQRKLKSRLESEAKTVVRQVCRSVEGTE